MLSVSTTAEIPNRTMPDKSGGGPVGSAGQGDGEGGGALGALNQTGKEVAGEVDILGPTVSK